MPDVIVIGAGPAGLTAAFKLRQKNLEVLVLEEREFAGGNVRTVEYQGFKLETGPHTFMGSNEFIFRLIAELNLEESLAQASPAAANRYIFREGRLLPLPATFAHFITTPLLSAQCKLRLMLEPFIPNRARPFETAWEFFCRRFGQEAATYIMSPFVSGIYAGDAKMLGARASFPKFWSFEKDGGSMILGAAKYSWRKRRRLASEGRKLPKGLFSFKQGMGTLTRKLAEKIGTSLLTGVSAGKISLREKKLVVSSKAGQYEARAVVIAAPPAKAADMLSDLLPQVSDPLKSIPMAKVALIHWSQPGKNFPPGFGFLMPRLYDLRVLGTLFPGQFFNNRAPEGQNLFASFYGGMLDPSALDLSDDGLIELLLKEHQIIFGRKMEKPEMLKIMRYDGAIPQPLPEHPEKISGILQELKKISGVFLAGNYLTGVGVEHAVTSGYKAAEDVREFVSGSTGG